MKMLSIKVIAFLVVCLHWGHCAFPEMDVSCDYSGLGRKCKNPGPGGVSEEDKKQIVDLHNWVRRIVASGIENRGRNGGQPNAANMRKMYWDESLARQAQRWADQCQTDIDPCAQDPRWNVTQTTDKRYPRLAWGQLIFTWYKNVIHYSAEDVKRFREDQKGRAYGQLVWHNSYAIGCGRRDFDGYRLAVCNYGPAGLEVGEPIYSIGEPCSQCPSGTFCDDLLCGMKQEDFDREVPKISGTRTNNDSEITYIKPGGRQTEQKPGEGQLLDQKPEWEVTLEKPDWGVMFQKTEGGMQDHNVPNLGKLLEDENFFNFDDQYLNQDDHQDEKPPEEGGEFELDPELITYMTENGLADFAADHSWENYVTDSEPSKKLINVTADIKSQAKKLLEKFLYSKKRLIFWLLKTMRKHYSRKTCR